MGDRRFPWPYGCLPRGVVSFYLRQLMTSQNWSHTQYLTQTYSILVLFLYSKLMRNIAASAVLIWFNDDSCQWLTFLGHLEYVHTILAAYSNLVSYTIESLRWNSQPRIYTCTCRNACKLSTIWCGKCWQWLRQSNGATENEGVGNATRSKMQGWKMQKWKMREQIAGVENAGIDKPPGKANRYYILRDP